MGRTEQQLRLVDLEDKRVQLKRQLRSARTALRLVVKERNVGAQRRGRTKTREHETEEIKDMARRLACLHSAIHICRNRIENPEDLRQKRREWYSQNKDRMHDYQRVRYVRDKEKILTSQSVHAKAKRAARSADPAVQAERARRKEEGRIARGRKISEALLKRSQGRVLLCTPERKKQWQQRYMSKPEAVERKRAYAQRPEVKARRNARNREKAKLRWKTDPQFALSSSLRCRIRGALAGRGLNKAHKTTELIGCSIEDLKRHLETNFLPGMTWENRGEWHIDHKRPCASFDLADLEQQRLCFHHTNLQPLWKLDNLRKGVKMLEAA